MTPIAAFPRNPGKPSTNSKGTLLDKNAYICSEFKTR